VVLVLAVLTLVGIEFQARGPATENDLSLRGRRVIGVTKSPRVPE